MKIEAMKLMMKTLKNILTEEQIAPNNECKECRRMKMQMVKLYIEVFTGHTSNRRNYGKG